MNRLVFAMSLLLWVSCMTPAQRNESSLKVKPVGGDSDRGRWCCKLQPESSWTSLEQLDLAHHTPDEELGYIYTNQLGFFDLSHARSHIDWFFSLYENIRNGQQNFEFGSADAYIWVGLNGIPGDAAARANLARFILYYYSGFYEWATFDKQAPQGGQEQNALEFMVYDHPSAFSPEDWPSDLCSTKIGYDIVVENPNIDINGFRSQVTGRLKNLVSSLGYNPPSVAQEKFNLIDGTWVWYRGNAEVNMPVVGSVGGKFLQRRNFEARPWLVYGPGNFGVGANPDCIQSFMNVKDGLAGFFARLAFQKSVGGGSREANSPQDVMNKIAEARNLATHGQGFYNANHDKPGNGGAPAPVTQPATRPFGTSCNRAGKDTCERRSFDGKEVVCDRSGVYIGCGSCVNGKGAGVPSTHALEEDANGYHDYIADKAACIWQ